MRQVRRGSHVRTRSLGIIWAAAIAASAAVAASGACLLNTETTLCETSGLICPPKWRCAAAQDVCIPSGGCGDGIKSPDEVCDDGNVLPGDSCSPDCKSDKPCGDSVVDPGEDCDAGSSDTQGCDKDCTFVECGDGYVNRAADEECDTGDPKLNTITCNGRYCKISLCGDSVYNSISGEMCDTGGDSSACNGASNSGNDTGNCQVPRCGDGYKNLVFTPPGGKGAPETCDSGSLGNTSECNSDDNPDGLGNCQVPRCGDGYKNPAFTPPGGKGAPEACDSGALGNTSQCNGNDNPDGLGNCQVPRCGDGYKNQNSKPSGSNFTEACDTVGDTQICNGDGNGNGANNSDSKCQVPACGDGYLNANYQLPNTTLKEQCDGGASNNDMQADACRTNCQKAHCGDGVADTGEACGDKPGNCGTGLMCSNCKCVPVM